MFIFSVTPSSLLTACQSVFESIAVGMGVVIHVTAEISPPLPGVF